MDAEVPVVRIRGLRTAVAAAAVAVVVLSQAAPAPAQTAEASAPLYTLARLRSPSRTVVTTADGRWAATFTDGSYTVTLSGPTRTFSERSANEAVTTKVWVRELRKPFSGAVDTTWLASALADRSPDVLAVAQQYLEGAPPIDASGVRIAGDASYGPLMADGSRQEGSDFNDYLGLSWTYGSYVDHPEPEQVGSLDCSGFVRMVFGYRGRVPLAIAPTDPGLPRRSFQMLASAPGVVTIRDAGTQVTTFRKLRAGDLVFFDADGTDGAQIDHVGIYLGRDGGGNYRFVSSRKSADGPTMGDYRGLSILNGGGLYARGFRAARRL